MMQRREIDHRFTARIIVWLAMCIAFLGYIRWGTELTSVTSFYFIRRSVPEIWSYFHDGLPQIGNDRLLDLVYWAGISGFVVGALALFWLALGRDASDSVAADPTVSDSKEPASAVQRVEEPALVVPEPSQP